MITVGLTEKEIDRLATFFRAQADNIAERLTSAEQSDLASLAKDLTELAGLAGKLEAAKSMSVRQPAIGAVIDGGGSITPVPVSTYSGAALDAGVPRRASK